MRKTKSERVILAALCASRAGAAAADFSLPQLPPPAYDDGEVSVMSVFSGSDIDAANRFRLSLALHATPSNSVDWDTVRLTTCGAGTADAAVAGRSLTDGAVIMVR